VLVAHYNHFFIHGYLYEGYVFDKQPLFSVFEPFYHYGTRAVEIFWCLSGFVFCFRYGDLNNRMLSFRSFFWLRISRLYPLHLITLIMVAALQWVYRHENGTYFVVEINNAKHFVLNLFFASNWGLQDGFSFNAPVWSVSLEILAYGFFFFITYWFGSGLLIALSCLAAYVVIIHLTGSEPVLVRCIFYFYLGCLSCAIYRASLGLGATAKAVALPAVATAAVIFSFLEFHRGGNLSWILNLGVPALLLLLASLSPRFPPAVARKAEILGNLTYASYLIHFPFQILVMVVAERAHFSPSFALSPYFFAGYVVSIFALSRVVYLRLEIPFQRLIRSRFVARPRTG
jgi:peptidoglycan/LPS O-acetylase OafA/YrhL